MRISRTLAFAFVLAVSACVAAVPAVFATQCDGKDQASPLVISKDMPPQILIGKPYAYTVSVTNRSGCAVEDVSVIETLPKTFQLTAATPAAAKTTGQKLQWGLGTLNPGETRTIKIEGSATAVGSFAACTKVLHSQTVCGAPELGMPAILLEVIDTEDPVQVGGEEKFYVTVTNQGNADDTNIVVKMGFEQNFDYVSSSGPTKAVAESAKSIEFAPLASLAPGRKATWEVTAKALSEGDHRTSIKLTSDVLRRSVDETESTHVY